LHLQINDSELQIPEFEIHKSKLEKMNLGFETKLPGQRKYTCEPAIVHGRHLFQELLSIPSLTHTFFFSFIFFFFFVCRFDELGFRCPLHVGDGDKDVQFGIPGIKKYML
jgi:hypothetical protein